MSIHIEIGCMGDIGKPFITVIDKRFETAEQARGWWEETGFNDGDGSVIGVLQAAEKEYVGTEHEIMTANTKRGDGGYTKLWCCIEGQEGKDTFDERLKDLVLEELVVMNDGTYQLNGRDPEGRRVWQSVRVTPDFKTRLMALEPNAAKG